MPDLPTEPASPATPRTPWPLDRRGRPRAYTVDDFRPDFLAEQGLTPEEADLNLGRRRWTPAERSQYSQYFIPRGPASMIPRNRSRMSGYMRAREALLDQDRAERIAAYKKRRHQIRPKNVHQTGLLRPIEEGPDEGTEAPVPSGAVFVETTPGGQRVWDVQPSYYPRMPSYRMEPPVVRPEAEWPSPTPSTSSSWWQNCLCDWCFWRRGQDQEDQP